MFHFLLLTAAVLATTHAATHSARGHAAARSSDVATLKEIYKGSNLINIPEPGSGQTPLMAAILSGQTKAVKVLLLELNADPTIPEKDGYTPPHGAGFQVCSTSRSLFFFSFPSTTLLTNLLSSPALKYINIGKT